jgi:FkbM family methyltransferase
MKRSFVRSALKSAVNCLPAPAREDVLNLIRRISKGVIARLPSVAKEAAFEQICDDFGRLSVMMRCAPHCNVVALSVSGSYGVLQGAPDDVHLLHKYAQTGTWAERTNSVLRSFFNDYGGNYIDIGANIGATTITVAQNPRVHCLAIEPEPQNFSHLRVNVAMNCQNNNVEIKRLAIFSRRQKLSFELSSENRGDHRLRIGDKTGFYGEEKRTTIDVEAVPLDEIAGSLTGPLAVKIDTQGAEPFVVSGGKETLGRASLVISEFWPYGMSRLGGDPEELIKFLRDQFSTIAIAMTEENTVSVPRPSSEVCKELSEFVTAHTDQPRMYLDVIARR